MIKAVLLDLDNTLLRNPDEVFAPAYLALAEDFFVDYAGYKSMSRSLLNVIRVLLGKRDMQRTNTEIALGIISQAVECEIEALEPMFTEFYQAAYPKLRDCVEPVTTAPALVNLLKQRAISVVIATNPIYPWEAIRQRLVWAGLPDQITDYALVTNADNMHFAKPDPAFYAEVVARVGVEPDEAIMVGDSINNDIFPATEVGLHTYHIIDPDSNKATAEIADAGTLQQLYELISGSDWLDTWQPHQLMPTMIEPELRGNVGALFGTISDVKSHFWNQHPDPNEWSPIQIICHLLDSERSVQRPRLERIRAEDTPFITAPKQPPGPREAGSCSNEGRTPAIEFARERLQTIEWLSGLGQDEWLRSARHSIFGPTTLLEMAHFTAQHDRLHINQLCQTLGRCI
jgi:FMN phosphatase YigB (HAD superfamily)